MLQNGQWNKVSFIKKILDTTDPSDAEWILYMEADTIIDAPGFTLPFEFYAGRDIVLLGSPTSIRAGDLKGEAPLLHVTSTPASPPLPLSGSLH